MKYTRFRRRGTDGGRVSSAMDERGTRARGDDDVAVRTALKRGAPSHQIANGGARDQGRDGALEGLRPPRQATTRSCTPRARIGFRSRSVRRPTFDNSPRIGGPSRSAPTKLDLSPSPVAPGLTSCRAPSRGHVGGRTTPAGRHLRRRRDHESEVRRDGRSDVGHERPRLVLANKLFLLAASSPDRGLPSRVARSRPGQGPRRGTGLRFEGASGSTGTRSEPRVSGIIGTSGALSTTGASKEGTTPRHGESPGLNLRVPASSRRVPPSCSSPGVNTHGRRIVEGRLGGRGRPPDRRADGRAFSYLRPRRPSGGQAAGLRASRQTQNDVRAIPGRGAHKAGVYAGSWRGLLDGSRREFGTGW